MTFQNRNLWGCTFVALQVPANTVDNSMQYVFRRSFIASFASDESVTNF